MTIEEAFAQFSAKFPKAVKAETQIKDYLTIRLSSPSELLPSAEFLKTELGFGYLEMVTGVDWLGPVSMDGYVRNPNPNVFLPEGATPEIVSAPTAGFNYRPTIDMLWAFGSISARLRLFLRLELPRAKASVPSLAGLFKSADWQEREVFDLMGVDFDGHPNLAKILTPDFLAGHPLRKDYVHIKDKYDED